MSIYARSLSHGIKRLFSLPRLTLPLIITLGLTLGAVLSVVAIVSVLLFKPLPGIKAEKELYNITLQLPVSDVLDVSFFNWRRLADLQQKFADYGQWSAIMSSQREARINDLSIPVTQYNAASNILDVLGTELVKGQGTDIASPEQSVWISNTLWQQQYAGRDSAVGKEILVQDQSYTIVGVIADLSAVSATEPVLATQIWLITDLKPLLADSDNGGINNEVTSLVLRSANNKMPDERDLNAWFGGYIKQHFSNPSFLKMLSSLQIKTGITGYRDSLVQGSRNLVLMLFAAVIGLLLMASLNLLNLFIAHYQSRSKEFAIQISLGASINRLRGMIMLENLPSFILAGILGLFVTGWSLRGLPTIAGGSLPLLDLLKVDSFTMINALIIVLLLAALFSFIALVDVNKHALSDSLSSSGKGTQGQTKQWLSQSLMVLQLSMASILLTGSVMLAKQSYDSVYQGLGYDIENVYSLSWAIGDEGWQGQLDEFENYSGSELEQLNKSLATRIEQLLPGSQAVTTVAPLNGEIRLAMLSDESLPKQILFMQKNFTENYFSTFNIEFLAGQAATQQQISANENVIVIDLDMAQQVFSALSVEQVIGKTIALGGAGDSDDTSPFRVIGVVAKTTPIAGQLEPINFPAIYRSFTGLSSRLNISVLMPEGELLDQGMLTAELSPQFPRLIDFQARSLTDIWLEQTLEQRTSLAVILTMTGLTFFLAIIGVGGLTQMTTSGRRYELAVRMATGAKQLGLLTIVFKQALWMLAIGLSLGFVLSVFGYNLVKQNIDIMPDFDWQSMIMLDISLFCIVILAVAVPAWRIIKSDPMQALREQ